MGNRTKNYCAPQTHPSASSLSLQIYPCIRFCFLPLSKPLSFDWMIICSCLHKHFLSNNYWHIHKGTLGPAGWAAQKVPVSRLSWGQFKLVIKLTCGVTFSFQAFVSSSESVACCVSLRLRQCANNYREPEACVCIWRTSCAVGGMCATAMIQAHRLDLGLEVNCLFTFNSIYFFINALSGKWLFLLLLLQQKIIEIN